MLWLTIFTILTPSSIPGYVKTFYDHNEVIKKCSFSQLSENEKKIGFEEKKGEENFFRKGLIDEWKTVLKKDLVEKIEKECDEEMSELKYL